VRVQSWDLRRNAKGAHIRRPRDERAHRDDPLILERKDKSSLASTIRLSRGSQGSWHIQMG
jgi:hypothetical protein